ncbi:aminoacyl tRNA synthase complex-interacting multifunctional protein 1 isoform X2 [Neltuma alba]|uniref:aminoacyl tRNA synthase complex-interacting multifunctional protein 1 isoform X2 n=1 Tax=Neltuma alba TaxID=207710 RepID=UPI0010A3D18B|nr:aminoacyl tRNA synthase complex-interacting multifunctional protein 1-like isoform X2 [Prosopis alba]
MAATASVSRKKLMVSALCKHFSLNPNVIPADGLESDVKSLYLSLSKASGHGFNDSNEVMKWVAFAEAFPETPEAAFEVLKGLNDELSGKSVLLGSGLKLSEADLVVFSAVHSSLVSLSETNREKLPHVLRWMDYVQHKEDFGDLFEKILIRVPAFEPSVAKSLAAAEAEFKESKAKKTEQSTKNVDKPGTEEKVTRDKDAAKGNTKPAQTEASEKDKELSVSLLNIQVGLIRKAWKHPSADSLLVEEIDVGDAKSRQVVSGLAKFCSPEELTNRRVVLITNVKPGKLRDVMSEGLVLCASNEDHTVVEPLLPPEGAKIGERVSFSGIDGKPEDVLNPKKKQLEKITPNLFTDEKGVATFKGIPFMTTGGPCTSSIPKATIK